jgi:hypothetical protein
MSQISARIIKDLSDEALLQKHPYFRVNGSGFQGIDVGTWTKVRFDNILEDSHNWFDDSTDVYEYTPLLSGIYFFYARIDAQAIADQNYAYMTFYKNEVAAGHAFYRISAAVGYDDMAPFNYMFFEMNGTNDKVSAYTYFSDAGNIDMDSTITSFGGFRIPKQG